MANLLSVVYSAGALSGTVAGTVSTVDQLIASGLPISGGTVAAAQQGAWVVTSTISGGTVVANATGTVTANQGGAWTVTANLGSSNTVVANQGGAWTVTSTISGGTVVANATGTVTANQGGTWTVQPGNTANTTPWLSKLNDGTNAMTIKAASTAPTATDTAIVVALSPNGINANGQSTMAGSSPVVIASNQSTLGVALDVSKVVNGASGTYLTPSYGSFSTAQSGATIVASGGATKIRILSMALTSSGTTNVKFQTSTGPADLTGLFYEVANAGFVLPYNPVGWFQTGTSDHLLINLSASVAVGGTFVYVAV